MNKIRLGQNNLNVRVIVFLLLSLLTATLLKFESVYAFPEELPVSYPAINSSIVEKKNRLKRVNEQYIIKFRESSTEKEKEDFLTGNGLPAGSKGKKITTVKRKIENYNKNIVEIIEEDGIIETESINTSDPLYKEQWYLEAVGFEKAFGLSNVSEKIVAVIDSGVCFEHPDLQGKILSGWNFVNANSDVTDTIGHGCSVSGIIGANINNQEGIAGAGVNVKILPLKVIGENGLGNYSDLIEAIDYAAEQNVAIINISLGGLVDSEILHQVIQEVTNKGIRVVASAGNTANNEIMYPAKYSEVVSVGSVENDYTVSNFSSNSQEIKLWAYGSNILTTDKSGDYVKTSGTSIAAAEVSAFIANGGEYGDKSIISYARKEIKPVFSSDEKTKWKDRKYSWTAEYSTNWNAYISAENGNPENSRIINRRTTFKTKFNEVISVDVWSNSNKKNLQSQFARLHSIYLSNSKNIVRGEVSGAEAIIGGDFSTFNNNLMHIFVFFNSGNNTYRITYSIINGSSYELFIEFVNNFVLTGSVSKKTDISNLLKLEIPFVYLQAYAEDNCGPNGEYYLKGNPFPCASICTKTKTNCVWWAIYKRPDLKDKITWGNAGQSWIDQANSLQVPVYTEVVDGSVVVWSGHVAYVSSHSSNDSFTISEMNCDITANPGPRDITVTKNYFNSLTFLGFIGGGDTENMIISNQIISSGTYTTNTSIIINPETVIKPSTSSIMFYINP